MLDPRSGHLTALPGTLRSDIAVGYDLSVRRHDCNVNAVGRFAEAQIVHDYIGADGVRQPSKRRASLRRPDHRPNLDVLIVSINVGEVRFAGSLSPVMIGKERGGVRAFASHGPVMRLIRHGRFLLASMVRQAKCGSSASLPDFPIRLGSLCASPVTVTEPKKGR
jgi:hypothetical protein